MLNLEECVVHCKRLIDLLAEDETDIAYSVQGEILDTYRAVISEELRMANFMLKELQGLTN